MLPISVAIPCRVAFPLQDLFQWHKRRLEVLAACPGTDLLACETLPSLREVDAIIAVLKTLPPESPKAWLTFACKDGAHLCDGSSLRSALVSLAPPTPHYSFLFPIMLTL